MRDPKTGPPQPDSEQTLDGHLDPCEPDTDPLGPALGERFQVGALLGRGGMGEVYAAEDLTLGRQVALKAIRSDRRLAPIARERFLREARLLGRLDHPGICRIHDLVDTGDRDVLVLELIAGRTLSEAGDSLSDRERLEVALQIATILEAAHAEGVVHRDLKPENIMITPDGQTKVLDFGLARDLAASAEPETDTAVAGEPFDADQTIALSLDLTDGVAVLGTPAYLSPEQARGEVATTASDIYAFGLVLQRLYTGRRAYEDSNDLMVVLDQAREARTLPLRGVDRDLARLIKRMEHRSPASRPTASEACRQLAWIKRRPVRRAQRWGAAAALVLVLAAGAKYTLDLRHERQIADLHRTEAEGLIEFMIGDLRERLEPVGRLDVLDEVGDRALDYFAARSSEERTTADQYRFARTMIQIGEVRLNQGNLDAAREAFAEGRRTVQALVEADPSQGEWLLSLGAAEFWLGNVDYMEGDLDAAQKAFQAYRVVADRLVALDPANEDWQRELGYAHTNLAALHEARSEVPEALAALEESVRIQRLLLAADPADNSRRNDLITSLAWQGRARIGDGDLQAAHSGYAFAVVEAETLFAREPDNVAQKELLSSLLHLEAMTGDILGDLELALLRYDRSLGLSEGLTRHDPENATWIFSLAATQINLGRACVQAGRIAEAEDYLLRAVTLSQDLVRAEPDNFEYRRNLAQAYVGLVLTNKASGDASAADRRAEQALVAARQAFALNSEREAVETLAFCLVLKGELAQDSGDNGRAQEAWQEAAGLLAPLAHDSRSVTTLDPWLRVQTYLNHKDQARDVARKLQEMGYAQRDYISFCRQHGIS
ncbi:MAG: protein kinase [Candidatus Krumholzibacteria bacterium]|nr:protein kinase [Candidatus Krumholzibacteria bacterium]